MDKEIARDVIRKAKKCGVDRIDILISENNTVSAKTRLTKLEETVQADFTAVKVRLSIGRRSAIIATDNLDDLREGSFLEKAIAAAKITPESDFKIQPETNELCKNFKKMDICDNQEIPGEKLIEDAQKCEEIALSIEGITNSAGAEASRTHSRITLLKSDDFMGEYDKTCSQISVVTLAEKNGNLQRDYDFSEAVYYSDLKTPEQIARKAAEKTLRRLGARKISSCKVPVIFEKMVARQLLSSLLDALNGATVAKGISFLKDRLSQKIFNDGLSVTDKYSLDRGLRSRPFDSDGLECQDNLIINKGGLNSFLLNTKYADQLKMVSTCNAYGFEGIAPNNVCIENGDRTFEDLMKGIKEGLFVTDVLGNGLNVVTGNYSQGAAGFWVENGEMLYPVHEVTIAGNFIDMFANCSVASDLEIETGIDSPTLFMEKMIVGGI